MDIDNPPSAGSSTSVVQLVDDNPPQPSTSGIQSGSGGTRVKLGKRYFENNDPNSDDFDYQECKY